MRKHLYIVRKEYDGFGGAENVAKRFKETFSEYFEVSLIYAGCSIEGCEIGGKNGPGWLKAIHFANSVNEFLASKEDHIVFSMSRGVPGTIFRVGDGIHKLWLRRRNVGFFKKFVNPTHWIYPKLERKSVTVSDFVVPNSRMVAKEVLETYDLEENRVRVISNGYDPQLFHYANDRERHLLRETRGASSNSLNLLFCANGWERKGLSWCIKLLGQVLRIQIDAHLWIIGRGEPQNYQNLVRELGVRNQLTFVGSIQDTSSWYQMADLKVLPTLYDPFSNSCLEALACGCPVLTTKSNGASECITPENGFILNNPEDIEHQEAIDWVAKFKSLDRQNISKSVVERTTGKEMSQYFKLLHVVKALRDG